MTAYERAQWVKEVRRRLTEDFPYVNLNRADLETALWEIERLEAAWKNPSAFPTAWSYVEHLESKVGRLEKALECAKGVLTFYSDTFNIMDFCKRTGPSTIKVEEGVTQRAKEALTEIERLELSCSSLDHDETFLNATKKLGW